MHGLLPAEAPRRTQIRTALAVLAVLVIGTLAAAVPARAGPTAGQAAGLAAQAGRISVVIDSVSPRSAQPGQTVTVSGTISNTSGQALAGLQVQLLSSAAPFPNLDTMDSFVAGVGSTATAPAGNPYPIASLGSHATASWHASFGVSALGMSAFGVYPLTVQVGDTAGGLLGSAPTLLPFWPRGQAASGIQRLKVSWLWPLIDQPHHQLCRALTDNNLAASLRQGGRLGTLLSVGQAHPEAHLTWAIDPALLSDAGTMTSRYFVNSATNCTGAVREPASKPARAWLSALKGVTSAQQAFITPYANVDVSALVHHGLTSDLASAYSEGNQVARAVLGQPLRASIAWPAGGLADLSVLTKLATAEHVGTVVLSSGEMPQADPADAEENAVTSISTMAGTSMTVLLADDTLNQVLRAASGTSSAGAEFAAEQRFLAETAMIVAQAPSTGRSVVVAPPGDWAPAPALASALLSETVHTPWLQPATLKSLTNPQGSSARLRRQPPPANKVSRAELSGRYLGAVSTLDSQASLYRSILYHLSAGQLLWIKEAMTATESSAWRGGRTAESLALIGKLSGYLNGAMGKVKIITSGQVLLAGTSGQVPVSIRNESQQAVQVRLIASAMGQRLVIGKFNDVATILPGLTQTVRLPLSAAMNGPTTIQCQLSSVDGTPLPGTAQSLTVQSTRYGRAILLLIAAAIGVLVLSSGYRGVRRLLQAGRRAASGGHADPSGHGDPGTGNAPGSVVTRTSGARHPTEAPDDLADARRWADDA